MNAACTDLNPEGTRRHVKGALKAGATRDEIMEVLKICVAQGVQACNLGVPILAEEMAKPISRGNLKQRELKGGKHGTQR